MFVAWLSKDDFTAVPQLLNNAQSLTESFS